MELSTRQIAEFEQSGIIIIPLFDSQDLQPLKDEISSFVDEYAFRALREGKISDLHEDKDFAHRMGYLMKEYPELSDPFDICNLRGTEMFRFMAHPKLLETLSPLFDGEITCSSVQHIRVKPPIAFTDHGFAHFNVPWHQDSGVAQPESDASLMVTVWCPIGPATDKMGCMRVIPGVDSHLEHESSDYGTRIPQDLLPDTEPVVAECREGDIVIMRQFTPHHSTSNRSGQCRWSMDLRYQKTGTPSARPWLPEFVVASKSDSDTVFTDYESWCAQWEAPPPKPEHLSAHRIG